MRNVKIAAAVAGIIAACGASAAFAGATTAAQANAAAFKFYTGGSSAAVSGVTTGVGADLCGGAANVTLFTSNPSGSPVGTPDFRAISCIGAKPAGAPWIGQQITIYYRAEGGSVVGAYGPLNNLSVNELNLATAACGAPVAQTDTSFQSNCTVGGTSPNNGPNDNYTSGVDKHVFEYGISDLEPGVFGNAFGEPWAGGGNDDPTGTYPFLGNDATPDQLQAMTHTLLFQQTFGLIANKGLNITDIPRQVAAAIFAGTLTDWRDVSIGGVAVKTGATAVPIHVCHRDLGSGTRTSVDIFFEQTGCNSVGGTSSLTDLGTNPDSFSTGDVLACVDGDANSIGYVSVDNFAKVKANTVSVTLDGQTASNKATAQGDYGWAFEASANKNGNIVFTTNQNTFWNYFIPALQTFATAPQSAQVNSLPGVLTNKSNNHTNGVLQTNGKIFITSYARDTTGAGNSCTPLSLH